jgi:hypothetical protein
MHEEKKDKYIEDLLSGNIPDQDVFSREEVLYIARIVCEVMAQQLEHEIKDCKFEDMENHIAVCEYTDIVEYGKDTEDYWEEEMLATADHIRNFYY